MAQEIDWLNSQAGMCKINFYQPDQLKDQRKVVCFVDVANLNLKDRFGDVNAAASRNVSDPGPDPDLVNLEEKEVIVIKDDEQSGHMNTEGAVCLLKQGTSKDANVVSWLSNDLQKYAIGFQHALTPSGTPHKVNVFDKMSCNNNNTAPSSSGSERGPSDDIAYYANKLCSLVLDMTQKEIKEKWESSGKYTRHTISPHSSGNKSTTTEDAEVRKPPPERSVRIDDSCPYERSCPNGFKMNETTYSDKERKHEDATSVSKGMMIYANQVASDMMLSFLKTLKVQKGRRPPPACVVLKEVLVRHAKEIVSDLIDSSMKNLHNVTGALMTDSDFVYGLKKNLYNVGTQKTAEILDAMVKRLFRLLAGDERHMRAQSLAFTSYNTGSQSGQRMQGMQFASLKRESQSHGQEKDRGGGPAQPIPTGSRRSDKKGSLEMYAKDLLVTVLTQIQQHLIEKNRDSGHRDSSNTSSFGYVHRDTIHDRPGESHSPKYSSRQYEGRAEVPDSLKDKGNLILSMVQKILQEAGLHLDDNCGDRNRR
ncbi:A-kinase anchor protein 4-like [Pogona vitticeps]